MTTFLVSSLAHKLYTIKLKSFKPYSALLVTSQNRAERVGQWEVGGVIHRVLCTRQLLSLAVKEGKFLPWLHK